MCDICYGNPRCPVCGPSGPSGPELQEVECGTCKGSGKLYYIGDNDISYLEYVALCAMPLGELTMQRISAWDECPVCRGRGLL